MTDQGPVVAIVGARAFRADIKRATDDPHSPLYAALKAAGMSVASQVAPMERGSLPVSGRADDEYHKSGWLAESVRPYATRTGAGVRVGFPSGPVYAGWVEFGGARHSPHLTRRQFVKDGRWLFPLARAQAGDVAREYESAMQRVLDASVLWTNTTDDPAGVHD